MHFPILHLPPHARQKRLHPLGRPARHARQQPERDAVNALHHLKALKHADFLQPAVFGPVAQRQVKDLLRDVFEARRVHHALEFLRDGEVDADLAADLGEDVVQFHDLALGGEGVVVGGGDHVHFDDFDPSAWLQSPVRG